MCPFAHRLQILRNWILKVRPQGSPCFLGFSPFLGFHTLTGLAIALFIQLEQGSHPFRSLVKHSLVDCSLLYDRHMGGDVGNEISNRQGKPQGDVPIGNGSRIHEFGFLEPSRLPMGPSPSFWDGFSFMAQEGERNRSAWFNEIEFFRRFKTFFSFYFIWQ